MFLIMEASQVPVMISDLHLRQHGRRVLLMEWVGISLTWESLADSKKSTCPRDHLGCRLKSLSAEALQPAYIWMDKFTVLGGLNPMMR